jgi:hypothetical protein
MYAALPVSLESPSYREAPELDLWREVLLLAIMDCRGQLAGVDRHEKRHAQERAHAWIFSTREDPGSFKWCCEVIGVDQRTVQSLILVRREPLRPEEFHEATCERQG